MRKFPFILLCFATLFVFTIDYGKIAESATETPFGGMHTITFDSSVCDCGGNTHFIIDYRTNMTLPLYLAPESKLYQYYNGDGLYQLGTYAMTGQHCWVEGTYSCYIIQYNYGQYGTMPGTGTTLM